ncbi:MAG: DUF4252 domain-containing protein [bacterium]
MKLIKFALLTFIIFGSNMLFAQKELELSQPGYFEFGDLSNLESGEKASEVLLEESLIKAISDMSEEKDPGISKLLSQLKFIHVNSFGITEKNTKNIDEKMKLFDTELLGKNWKRIVSTRDKKTNLSVYIKSERPSKIEGLVILAKRKNAEATFVNIVGNIDLKSLGKLGQKFHIPSLDKFKESIGENEEDNTSVEPKK